MICDLLNNQAPTTYEIDATSIECKLLYPVICTFRAMDRSWLRFLPRCHTWLFALVVSISRNRGWDVHDIYRGVTPVNLIATHEGTKNTESVTLRLTVEGFQYSKMTFSKEG